MVYPKALAAAAAILTASASAATPALMVQPKGAVIVAGGPGYGSIADTYNQAGLEIGYIDEVTSLHPYTSTPPLHTTIFPGFEWFGNLGKSSVMVSYFTSPAKVRRINHFVHWNEESSGIGYFNLWFGAFPGDFSDLVISTAMPPDHPLTVVGFQYPPDVYEFRKRPATGWWTLEMHNCPQPDPADFPSCAIGEVAFGGIVPEPATWGLLVAGFGLVGWAARRRTGDVARQAA